MVDFVKSPQLIVMAIAFFTGAVVIAAMIYALIADQPDDVFHPVINLNVSCNRSYCNMNGLCSLFQCDDNKSYTGVGMIKEARRKGV